MILTLPVTWDGPFDLDDVVTRMDDGGEPPAYAGNDYGLYQIYGEHIISGPDTLLYIGRATQQTFASRIRQHSDWIRDEEEVHIFVGRIFLPERHAAADGWASWEQDVRLAECIMIYKYSPNYNSISISEPPDLRGFERVLLLHRGKRHRLKEHDVAPDDWL